MKTPDTFKGFGIPEAVKIIPIREETRFEFDRVFAAYQRQGLSKERAANLLGISVVCLRLEQHGFEQGRDFRYSSAKRSLLLSPAAEEHVRDAVGHKNWDRIVAEFTASDPLKIDSSDIGMVDGEHITSPAGFAKAVVGRLLGRELPAQFACIESKDHAIDMACNLLTRAGMLDEDIVDLLRNALAGADGAEERLVQRLEMAIKRFVQGQVGNGDSQEDSEEGNQ